MLYTKNAAAPTATLMKLARYTLLNTSGGSGSQYLAVDLNNPITMVSRYSAQESIPFLVENRMVPQ
jgi:hypothetical protein